ncbi:hypothetical protein [Streptomyces sp. NPDC059819]|uniref:hypothetical protein n=1 Tax=Streptomyces sp. NPDC059819 TaxID=3346963 RepID=UPI003648A0E1
MGSTGVDPLGAAGRTGAVCGAAEDVADVADVAGAALPAEVVLPGVALAGVVLPGVAEGAAGRVWRCGTAEGEAEPGWLGGAVTARCTAGLAPDPPDGAAAERGAVGRDPGVPPPGVTPDTPCPALPDGLAGLAGLAGVGELAEGATGM